MSRFVLPALLLAFATTGAFAQDGRYGPPPPPPGDADNAHFGWADVLRVDPVYGIARTETPRQECYDQEVTTQSRGTGSAGAHRTFAGAEVARCLRD